MAFRNFSWNRLAGCINAVFKVTGSRFIVKEAAENIRTNNNNRDWGITVTEFTDTFILPSSNFI